MTNINLHKLTPAEHIKGEDAEETVLLNQMLNNAKEYLEKYKWCPPIDKIFLGFGIGGVVAVFLFHFNEQIEGKDDWLWVIEGDLPSAYIVLDQASNPASALEVYCGIMEDWAKAVTEARPINNLFPVKVEPSVKNAEGLLKRIKFIRERLLPKWRASWVTSVHDVQ
ncbi:MAG: hypothetical protein A2Y12_19690 [Planctomycetes bacterium GWF2_42_9]|nr:MAG: hypothetical protein A2Y12_19690 [Planctomycetes bacterium GWF2_42_9]